MNCVGFFAIWSDTAFFMRGAPAHPGSTCTHAMGEQLSTLKSTPTDGASLCWSFGVGRIDNDLDGAPTRIRVRAFSFPESECFELRIIKGEIADEVVSHDHGASLCEDQVLLRISRCAQ